MSDRENLSDETRAAVAQSAAGEVTDRGSFASLDELLEAGSEAWIIVDAETYDELAGPYDTRADAEEAARRMWKPGAIQIWPISL